MLVSAWQAFSNGLKRAFSLIFQCRPGDVSSSDFLWWGPTRGTCARAFSIGFPRSLTLVQAASSILPGVDVCGVAPRAGGRFPAPRGAVARRPAGRRPPRETTGGLPCAGPMFPATAWPLYYGGPAPLVFSLGARTLGKGSWLGLVLDTTDGLGLFPRSRFKHRRKSFRRGPSHPRLARRAPACPFRFQPRFVRPTADRERPCRLRSVGPRAISA